MVTRQILSYTSTSKSVSWLISSIVEVSHCGRPRLLSSSISLNFSTSRSGTWSQPIFGYFVAFIGQLVLVIGLLTLFRTYPSFHFLEGTLILVILLVALGWGAGPSVIALLVGVVLLIFFVFPPSFTFRFGQSAEVIELLLYIAVGLTISILASNTERSRRTSEQLPNYLRCKIRPNTFLLLCSRLIQMRGKPQSKREPMIL